MKRLLLERLHDRFIELVKAYMQKNGLKQLELAEVVRIQRTHLSALLNKSRHRRLSACYMVEFIRKGVFSVKEIYDGKAETKREEEFWATATEAENYALLRKIARLRKEGIDIKNILDQMYPNT